MVRRLPLFVVIAWVFGCVAVQLAAQDSSRPAGQAPPAPAAGAPAAPAGGQGAAADQPAQQPTFQSRVDAVVVDVSVTDKQGNPVTDLKPEDFEIRESGKPQTVETFKLVQTDDGLDDPAAKRDIKSLDDQRRETEREENRLFVIFLDDYHVRFGNSVGVRDRLARFVRELSPHDLVALITPLQPPAALTFTRNHDGILNDIMSFQGRKYDYHPKNELEERYAAEPPAVQEQIRNDWVVSALRHLCEYMGTLRDGRKTLLYVSEGMSATLPIGVATTGTFAPPPSAAPPDPFGLMDRHAILNASSLLNDLQTVFGAAARSNTNIYTLDPRGLANGEYSVADVVSASDDRRTLDESLDNLRVLAEETNGRAIVGANDPIPALKQMVRDNSTYYLLGYVSTLAPRDGKFHEIQVRVKRRDLQVRARKGYWALSNEDIARAAAPSRPGPSAGVVDALDAMSTGTESSRRQSVALWSGARRGSAEKALVTVAWEATENQTDGASARVDHVNVTATSADGATLFTGPVTRDPASARAAGQATFEAPAGTVQIKVEAQNGTGRRIETDETIVEVPDFSTTKTQIGTPFIYRGRTARDLQLVRSAPAPVPAVVHSFSRTERILIRFGAYAPGGTTPKLAMKLLNTNGDTIAALPDPVKTDAGLFESELGLGGFPPGDYVIQLSADANGDVTTSFIAVRVTG
jgi:VWFA-related protein